MTIIVRMMANGDSTEWYVTYL